MGGCAGRQDTKTTSGRVVGRSLSSGWPAGTSDLLADTEAGEERFEEVGGIDRTERTAQHLCRERERVARQHQVAHVRRQQRLRLEERRREAIRRRARIRS